MNSFLIWCGRNRKRIGYSAGVLNIMAAIVHVVHGEIALAMLWSVIGLFFIVDAFAGS